MLFSAGLTLAAGLLFTYIWIVSKAKRYKTPPGPFQWPILGNTVQLLLGIRQNKYMYSALMELASKYGAVMHLTTAASNIVVVSGYESVKEALGCENFLARFDPTESIHMERSFGGPIGISNSNGDWWAQTRRLSTRHLKDFGFAKRQVMNETIHEEYDALVGLLDKKMDGLKEIVVEPESMFNIATANVTWRSISGQRFDLEDPVAIALVKSTEEIFRNLKFIGGIANLFPVLLDWFPGLMGRTELYRHIHIVHGYTKKLVSNVRALGKYKLNQNNFVEAFLRTIDDKVGEKAQDVGIYTDLNLVVSLTDMILGAQDTSGAILAFFFRYMLHYPDVQDKMRQEINSLIEPVVKIALEDKTRLKFCRAVTLESHRHATIVPISGRRVSQDTIFKGYVVPAKTSLILNYYSANHDKKFWGDPEVFRPERFLSSKGDIINADRVFIFGGGKRDCPGQTVADAAFFMFACNFVRDYVVLPVPGETYNLENTCGFVSEPKPFKFVMKRIEY